jgi:hypothetical protein
MFGVARWVPFVVASALGGLIVLALPTLWRSLPGRVHTELSDAEHAMTC